MKKYCILTNDMSDYFLRRLEKIFPMNIEPMYAGFKYLGFHLKPNEYKKDDWTWLINKMEYRLTFWCYIWISQGGRLVLIKYVMVQVFTFIGYP